LVDQDTPIVGSFNSPPEMASAMPSNNMIQQHPQWSLCRCRRGCEYFVVIASTSPLGPSLPSCQPKEKKILLSSGRPLFLRMTLTRWTYVRTVWTKQDVRTYCMICDFFFLLTVTQPP
jgi:hypothetical protein